MKNWDYRKKIDFIRKEKRSFLALAFLVLVFLVNEALYAKHKKTADSCANGKCLSAFAEKPQLTKENGYYFVDDLFKNQSAGYYRLTFQEKSNQAEKVLLKLNTYSEKENQIGEFNFDQSDKFQKQELFFFLPEGFDSLLFQKENAKNEADIFIKEVGISKLNITDQSELAMMKKTIIGETDASVVNTNQLASDYSFPWLKENKTVLGQIFQAKENVISAVELKIDINKNLNPGSRQYVLSLREVNYNNGEKVSFSGPIIADTAFSVDSIEKYRQMDGTFLFPLYGSIQKGKYYLVSLDNSKVAVGNQNYLELRGSKNNDSYPSGSAVMKKYKDLYTIDGDLYFKIYGAELFEEDGVKILNGAKIEYLGKGTGKYSYVAKGKFADLLDLETASSGTEFSESYKAIFAPAKDEASFSYVINTIHPISKLNFSASQIKAGWKNVMVTYSFNQNDWTSLPFSENLEDSTDSGLSTEQLSSINSNDDANDKEDNTASNASDDSNSSDKKSDEGVKTIQEFNADIIPTKEVRTIYFKVTYDAKSESAARLFGLKNLKITADLKIK